MGCDSPARVLCPLLQYFNPRSPNGLRPLTGYALVAERRNFNPRSPNGLRLFNPLVFAFIPNISIHAARMGCDRCWFGGCGLKEV